ncbi:chromosome replication initiation inhibitor protein [Marinomonas sp. MED121]|uniref:ArgP/LysG family DNA-binding transcriptional regulator n=1 Tax=Marinomonas sp. MED121 TaxID=314277 RepID=UPI0000690327|nr:ArgP/LysG family DNA-binding transcriptional regulator [Marinomonas sp. MED121]EAQ66292.1 chromosome replication initiation inhibitor protein [Marinomonas sp. MED121]
MDYKAIECLRQVVESQGFEKAGDVLGLTQSAVSQKIKRLEQSYNSVLLIRDKPLRLTALGKKLNMHYIKVQLMEQALVSESSGDQSLQCLPIAINNDSLATWFIHVISKFSKDENRRLQCKIADQSLTRDLLKKGEVVAALSDTGASIAGGESLYLGSMDYILVASPKFIANYLGRRFTALDIAKVPALIFDENDQLWSSYQTQILGLEGNARACHWLPSSQGFVQMLLSDNVCGLVPKIQIEQELKEGRLVELMPKKRLKVPLFWHWCGLDSALISELTDTVVRQAKLNLS